MRRLVLLGLVAILLGAAVAATVVVARVYWPAFAILLAAWSAVAYLVAVRARADRKRSHSRSRRRSRRT